MLRIPPLGRFSSPAYRGIIWQRQCAMVWPAAAPTFAGIVAIRFKVPGNILFTRIDEVGHGKLFLPRQREEVWRVPVRHMRSRWPLLTGYRSRRAEQGSFFATISSANGLQNGHFTGILPGSGEWWRSDPGFFRERRRNCPAIPAGKNKMPQVINIFTKYQS
jgi:hypothetical protein